MTVLTFAKWIAEAPAWILALPGSLQRFCFQVFQVFVYENRWRFFTDGLATTFLVTIGALIIGVIIGMIVAIIRSTHDSSRHRPNIFLRILNSICKIYVTVLRGTPLMVQLLIMGFVIMVPKGNTETVFCAIITLGINSGAYVAEIARSGIMSINAGQMEAGRSLGLNYWQTMSSIILPQAFKNILPALGNELIALLKEIRNRYICSSSTVPGSELPNHWHLSDGSHKGVFCYIWIGLAASGASAVIRGWHFHSHPPTLGMPEGQEHESTATGK